MYPNPSDQYIMFNKSLEFVRIYDITGKELMFYENLFKGQQISIDNLDSGYYLIKVESNNVINTKALIKK